MSVEITGPEVDECAAFIRQVLTAYKNGWCSLDDAQGSLHQVLEAARRDNHNLMGEVRGHSKMFLRDA